MRGVFTIVQCDFLFCENPLFEKTGLKTPGGMARRGSTTENGSMKSMEVVMMQGL